ncbi:hypothetical protein B0T26DRAFT_671279 [Lasiosphaeria miniovina]|uniref:Uncharacterized protein n=1 Tax=Lasiosphaeria miniovina TaxID=1954250 RepID=A0AA40BIY4_9PEZI|nr:uncharacterized protein B0T26DRAFT_671279 [Lasiosphaeria miniovina]KAK0735084.1 hypothetical protein B0T26DRAFT_671279 [Lasiosphaeria miniovina]
MPSLSTVQPAITALKYRYSTSSLKSHYHLLVARLNHLPAGERLVILSLLLTGIKVDARGGSVLLWNWIVGSTWPLDATKDEEDHLLLPLPRRRKARPWLSLGLLVVLSTACAINLDAVDVAVNAAVAAKPATSRTRRRDVVACAMATNSWRSGVEMAASVGAKVKQALRGGRAIGDLFPSSSSTVRRLSNKHQMIATKLSIVQAKARAREFMGDTNGIIYFQTSASSGRSTVLLAEFLLSATESALKFKVLCLTNTRIEAELLQKNSGYFGQPCTRQMPVMGGFGFLSYNEFSALYPLDTTQGYTELLVILETPPAATADFEIAKATVCKLATQIPTVNIVGFGTGVHDLECFQSLLSRDIEVVEVIHKVAKSWREICWYKSISSGNGRDLLVQECANAVAQGRTVVSFLNGSFPAQIHEIAGPGLGGSANLIQEKIDKWTPLDQVSGVKKDADADDLPRIVSIEPGSLGFRLPVPRPGLVVMGARYVDVVLDENAAFITVSRVICPIPKNDINGLPKTTPPPAYNAEIMHTVLGIVHRFRGKEMKDMPFNWSRSDRMPSLVREIARRLELMGLVSDSGSAPGSTDKGDSVLREIKAFNGDINAACLAVGALTDDTLSRNAARLLLRMAVVASRAASLARVTPEAPADEVALFARIQDDCWGLGRFARLGHMWILLGLWESVRFTTNNFEDVEDRSFFLAGGAVKLSRPDCLGIWHTLQQYDEQFEAKQDEPAPLSDSDKEAIHRHLLGAYVDFKLQEELSRDTDSLVLVATIRRLALSDSGIPPEFISVPFITPVVKEDGGKYFIGAPTFVPPSALTTFRDRHPWKEYRV